MSDPAEACVRKVPNHGRNAWLLQGIALAAGAVTFGLYAFAAHDSRTVDVVLAAWRRVVQAYSIHAIWRCYMERLFIYMVGGLFILGRLLASAEEAGDLDKALQQGYQLYQKGQLDAAEQVVAKAVKQAEAADPKGERLGTCLVLMAAICNQQGRFGDAIHACERALRIFQDLGADVESAKVLTDMGTLYLGADEYEKAVARFNQALPLREKLHGKESVEVASVLTGLGVTLRHQGRIREAEPALERALAIYVSKLGKDHVLTAKSWFYLARVHLDKAEFDQSEALYKKALLVQEQALGANHPDTANSYLNLSGVYEETNQLLECEKCLIRSLQGYTEFYGAKHYMIGLLQSRLGTVQLKTGQLANAEAAFEHAERIFAETIGRENLNFGEILVGKAAICERRCQWDRAAELLEKNLAVRVRVLGQKHKGTANARIDLACLYLETKRAREATVLAELGLSDLERALGADHPDVAQACLKVAKIQMRLDLPEEAARFYRQAAGIFKRVKPLPAFELTVALNELADVLIAQRRFDQAEETLRESLRTSETQWGKASQHRLSAVYGWARLCQAKGDYAQSVSHFEEVLRTAKQASVADDGLIYAATVNLPLAQALAGRTAQALANFEPALAAVLERRMALLGASRSDRIRHAYSEQWVLSACVSTVLASAEPRKADLILEAALAFKGAALNLDVDELRGAMASNDPELSRLAIAASQARRELASFLRDGMHRLPRPAAMASKQELERKVALLESDLGRRSFVFLRQQKVNAAGGKEVIAALPPEACLVYYLLYRHLDLEKGKGTDTRLAACVASRKGPVCAFDLCSMDALNQAASAFLAACATSPDSKQATDSKDYQAKAQALSDLVLKPLWAQVRDFPRWIVSPDAVLSVVPLALLPQPQSVRLVIEDKEVTYVNSGREIAVMGTQRVNGKGALVLGDPDFDAKIPGLAPPRASSAPENPFAAFNEAQGIAGETGPGKTLALAPRSAELQRIQWLRLPGTQQEAEALAATFKEKGIPCEVKTGASATRQALFEAQAPRFLHIATHGYYLPDQQLGAGESDVRGLAGIVSRPGAGKTSGPERDAWTKLENPLLRSALVFAGANSEAEPANGIVTAYEVTGLNLWQTEMVVLSACETALGSIQMGEGVMGLRRSFLQSGAQTVVTSLWKVPDFETKMLMESFYRPVLDGKRKGLALREAMLALRARLLKEKGAAPPKLWAAFILCGNPD